MYKASTGLELMQRFFFVSSQEEPEAKWPLLTLARVREAQAALQQQQQQANRSPADAAQQAGGRTAVAAATGAEYATAIQGRIPRRKLSSHSRPI